MIKYLGSKRTLIDELLSLVQLCEGTRSTVDLFAGTSRVGHALKRGGYQVHSNDYASYAKTLAECYVAADRGTYFERAEEELTKLSTLTPKPGYFTKTFCEEARFFQPENGARVDAIREAIEHADYEPLLKSVLLTSLMEAADRVDSTCGVQMAYVKKWAKRSYQPLTLRVPDLAPAAEHGPCSVSQLDALEAAKTRSADLVYLDPPYNQHSYLSNYHIWETLVRWDAPEAYGVARKRIDCKTRKSALNSKPKHHDAMRAIVDAIDARYLVVSFNDEGYLGQAEMEAMLQSRGEVVTFARDYRRYVGAQIGQFAPSGKRVGEISHLRNQELIYVVVTPEVPERDRVLRALLKRRGKAPVRESHRAERLRAVLSAGSATLAQLGNKTGLSPYHIRQGLLELADEVEREGARGPYRLKPKKDRLDS